MLACSAQESCTPLLKTISLRRLPLQDTVSVIRPIHHVKQLLPTNRLYASWTVNPAIRPKNEPPSSYLPSLHQIIRSSGVTGGGERDRTDDPLLAKQVLSQLSYTPMTHRIKPSSGPSPSSGNADQPCCSDAGRTPRFIHKAPGAAIRVRPDCVCSVEQAAIGAELRMREGMRRRRRAYEIALIRQAVD